MSHKANHAGICSITVFAAFATTAAPILINRFLNLNSDAQVAYTGAGEDADYISLGTAERTGEPLQGSMPIGSINKIESGAAIAKGDKITSDATGRAVTATTGDIVLGKAVTASGAAGEVIGATFSPRGEVTE